MDDHVIHKSALRIEQSGVLACPMASREASFIEMCCTAASASRSGQADVAHVADVKDAHAGANGNVLGDNATRRRIFDRHVPAIELDHVGAHLAMNGVQRGLADGGRCRLNGGQ